MLQALVDSYQSLLNFNLISLWDLPILPHIELPLSLFSLGNLQLSMVLQVYKCQSLSLEIQVGYQFPNMDFLIFISKLGYAWIKHTSILLQIYAVVALLFIALIV